MIYDSIKLQLKYLHANGFSCILLASKKHGSYAKTGGILLHVFTK